MNDDSAEASWQTLSRRVIIRWRLQVLGYAALAAVIVSIVMFPSTDDPLLLVRHWPWSAPVVALVAVLGLIWPPLVYRSWRYRLAVDALELERGVIIQRRSSVPYGRVQQIDVTRGLVDRLLGLSVAKLLTASSGTDGSVPGLTPEAAEHFRGLVLERAGRDDAV